MPSRRHGHSDSNHLAPAIPLLALFLTLSAQAWAAPAATDWRLWRETEQVQVFARTPANRPYAEIRAQTVVATTLSAFVNLLRDTTHAQRWIARVQSVTELERLNETENRVETRFEGFWPVQERWVQTRSVFSQSADSLQLTLEVNNLYQTEAVQKRRGIQMLAVEARWQLTPLPDGRIHIEYQGYADPGGQLPAWLTNSAALNAILQTLIALRQELRRPEYLESRVDFIREPAVN